MISPHIVRKTTSPVAAPPEAGIHWINTTSGEEFFSVGADDVSDWLPRSTGQLPLGGTTGQVPAKASDADFDIEWVDGPSNKLDKHTGATYNTYAIQTLTAAEYAAIGTPDADTLYFII